MSKRILLPALVCLPFFVTAQLEENFSDGNFTANPSWTGAPGNWTINSAGQLQSANSTANNTFWLSTESTLCVSTQWEFYMRLQFNTSNANYADVYLTASAADLSLNTTTGYFVRIGNTSDEISLYRKDGSGTITKLIDGVDGITNTNDNILRIKITRDASYRFTLYRNAGGSSYVTEGSVLDATYTTTSHFGFLVRQSTASFFGRHFIDDISIQPFYPDLTPPDIRSVVAVTNRSLEVLFSEAVSAASSERVQQYEADQGAGHPVAAQRDATNPALVHLQFAQPFTNGVLHTLTVRNVEDLAGNRMSSATGTFSFYTAQRFDVVIHEIMADPSPPVSLPNTEYVELKNRSGRSLNLQGWRLSTRSGTSSAFPFYELPADGMLILTTTAAAASFSSYGKVLGVGAFPALDNNGTILSLVSKEGATIHAVEYADSWYGNAVKKEGGWSLEMVDAGQPCTGPGNWKASTDAAGGTPGKTNSVAEHITDQNPPQIIRSHVRNGDTVVLFFSEPLDSTAAADPVRYKVSNATVLSVGVLPPLFNSVELKLSAPLEGGRVYTVVTNGLQDCKGNGAGEESIKTGWALPVSTGQMVINEMLFNPRSGGSDYVEIWNNSSNVADASQLYLANRNAAGEVSSLKKLAETPLLIFPGDYLAFTDNKLVLQQHYFLKEPAAVYQLSSLPSYPDDKGNVLLVNHRGEVVDEVAYDQKWHFALLSDKNGVALERIDPQGPSQDKNNWHSAAATAGYGTPGYRNSQYRLVEDPGSQVEIRQRIFSPDGDGIDDLALIQYALTEGGYVANVAIFDAQGRPVRQLVRNALLGLKGIWTWDGLNNEGKALASGTYIIFTELFNLQGKKKTVKQTIVLARR